MCWLFAVAHRSSKLSSSFMAEIVIEERINSKSKCSGWKIKDCLLEVQWMNCQPAPDAILELMSCLCSNECSERSCPCIRNVMKCTDMCKLQNCTKCTGDSVWYFKRIFWQWFWELKLKPTIILIMMIYCEQIISFSCPSMLEFTRTSVFFRIRLIRLSVSIEKFKQFIVSYSYNIQFSIIHRLIRNSLLKKIIYDIITA